MRGTHAHRTRARRRASSWRSFPPSSGSDNRRPNLSKQGWKTWKEGSRFEPRRNLEAERSSTAAARYGFFKLRTTTVARSGLTRSKERRRRRRRRRRGLTRSPLCRGPGFLSSSQRGSLRLKRGEGERERERGREGGRRGKIYLPKNGTATRVTCAYRRETNVGDGRTERRTTARDVSAEGGRKIPNSSSPPAARSTKSRFLLLLRR